MEAFWYFRGIRIFRLLGPELTAKLSRMGHEETYPHHQTVSRFQEGQQLVYLVVKGRLKLVKHHKGKDPETLVVLEPGDVYGAMLAADDVPETIAESMDETTIRVLPYHRWLTLLRKHHRLSLCARRWGKYGRPRFEMSLAQLSGRCVTARLASVLLELMTHYQDWCSRSRPLKIRLSSQQLTMLVGADKYVVDEILRAFKQTDVARIRGRRLYILNPWALKKWSKTHNREIEAQPEPEPQEDIFPLGDDQPSLQAQ